MKTKKGGSKLFELEMIIIFVVRPTEGSAVQDSKQNVC